MSRDQIDAAKRGGLEQATGVEVSRLLVGEMPSASIGTSGVSADLARTGQI